ncbi:MAG: lysophospholipase L1-like esterase [Planctomycetota bacterium]|jgi:lysophospholipase L1-like esterase
MKAINVLLAILVSLFVFLAVFELGLRAIGMGPPKTLNQFNSALGWSKAPERTVHRKTAEYDVHFAINELGLRDDEDLTVEKPEDTERVICLGDSFTLGYTVERQHLFVDQLEHWWQKEDRKVQVINTGTEGYSTDQEVAWLLENGDAWQPDLVLLFAYENDLFYNGASHYLRFPKPRFTPEGTLEPAALVDPGSKGLFASTALGNLVLKKKGLETFETPLSQRPLLKEFGPLLKESPEFMADAMARTTGALKALRQKCDELNAKVAVVVLPSHSAIDEDYAELFATSMLGMARDDWDPNKPVDLFLQAARSAGLTALDPRSALRKATEATGPTYFHKDFHLNAHGNQVIAKFVHDSLATNNMTPGAGQVIADMPTPPAPSKPIPRWLLIYCALWGILGSLYGAFYKDEKILPLFLKVGGMLALIFTVAVGGSKLLSLMPPTTAKMVFAVAIIVMFSFIFYKLGDRLSTIFELLIAFVRRGHWYLMPLVMILLSVGSLLVVAASSPLVAPFIYTLF